MSRIDGAGRNGAAGDASERVPEDGKATDPAAERRAAEAEAERRRNEHFGAVGARGGAGSRTPAARLERGRPSATSGPERPAISAVGARDAEPASMATLASEVMRLRGDKAMTTDPARSRALGEQIHALSSRWCEMARARGMKPPSDAFEPSRASDAELASAILWTEVGNTYPLSALVDGGARLQKELQLTLVVRSPELLAQAIATGRGDDPALLVAMHKELGRLGDPRPCMATDTLESLAGRRASILRQQESTRIMQEKEDARLEKTIGLDGRVGTAESVIGYEIEQGLSAANPGSFLGGLGAGISASRGGSIDDRRRAGQAGNAAQGLAGIASPGDPTKKPPATFQNEPARRGAEIR